jgi:heterodisulfide reductase subunit A
LTIKEEKVKKTDTTEEESKEIESEEPRIGVFICHCGHNIAGTVDVAKVADYAKTLPNVVKAEHYMFMCSKPGVQMVKDSIKELGVNRTVVASCSKNQHGKTLHELLRKWG